MVTEKISRLLLGDPEDRRRVLRIKRLGIALASYAMWYAIAWVALQNGFLVATTGAFILAGVGILFTQALFYFLIRSNISLRWQDPSITLAQIINGLFWSLVLIAVSRELRGLMIAVYMITLLFSIFALERRAFLVSAVVGFCGYLALMVYERLMLPGLFTAAFYAMSLAILGVIILWTTAFAAYVSNLRFKLRQRNEELLKALQRNRELAEHDDLTGLFNRRYIMSALHKMKARAERTGETFSIVLIDLDHFKEINDRFGHLAGDRALTDFAVLSEEVLRSMDIVVRGDDPTAFGRYGGEEFIILLPRTDEEGARRCAERLRLAQENVRQHGGEGLTATLSAGIAEFQDGESIESLLRRADRALYLAKDSGRNQVRA